jgi:hypothetical protein
MLEVPSDVSSSVDLAPGDLLRAANAEAYRMPGPELVGYLKGYLGRPLIAYMTGIADANTVSRWSSGKVDPERATWERLRTLATIHLALTRIVGSPESAGQWFTGWNPDLERSPADELRDGNVGNVFAAVRLLAQQ